ncbi:MAG: hypothetical protein EOP05_19285 [Proteobacteria bacterium]|nr:MAG: hypothetical protein EOP05_19285 [Pseudomonadota bacterium]
MVLIAMGLSEGRLIMRAKQADFFEKNREVGPRRSQHGGSISRGKRKVSRPLDTRKPVHLVLKSSSARLKMSFLAFKNKVAVQKIVRERAKQFGVAIHGFELMSDHVHLVASFESRAMFQSFLRTITGLIARHVTGAKKGKPFGKRFFDGLAFTRVVQGLKDMRGLKIYLFKNEVERDVHPMARADLEREAAKSNKARRRCGRAAPATAKASAKKISEAF